MTVHSHGKLLLGFCGIHACECRGVQHQRRSMVVQSPCHLFFSGDVQVRPTQAHRCFTS